jgi:hypothetical protein
LAICQPLDDLFVHGSEPRFTVGVVQGDSAAHLFNVGGRMEAVGVVEWKPQLLGQERTYRRLSGAQYARDNNDHSSEKAAGGGLSVSGCAHGKAEPKVCGYSAD